MVMLYGTAHAVWNTKDTCMKIAQPSDVAEVLHPSDGQLDRPDKVSLQQMQAHTISEVKALVNIRWPAAGLYAMQPNPQAKDEYSHLEGAHVLQFGATLGILDASKQQLLNLGRACDVHVLGLRYPSSSPTLEVLASFSLICLCLDLGFSQVLPAGSTVSDESTAHCHCYEAHAGCKALEQTAI